MKPNQPQLAAGDCVLTAHDMATASLLFTTREAARMLRVCERTLWGMTKRGEISAVRVGRRGVRYSVKDLELYVERAKGTHPPPGE